jgi:hypothetical protein
VFDDAVEHPTACHHPLSVGEDLSLARPDIDASEIAEDAAFSVGAPSSAPTAPTETGGESR